MQFDSTVHPISWFRDRYREGALTIKPPYQRKPVWAARQKCYLIESVLLRLPIPEIYVQQTTSPEGETKYAIVDGQQRIRTVLQFVGSETDPGEQEHNKFVLDMLPADSDWRNRDFASLSDDEKKAFYGYKFAVRYLNTESDEEVRDMFERLNRFLTPLKPQELRNSRFTGPFVQLTLALADDEFWAENRIVRAGQIRRMGDVEFVSELLIGVLHGPQDGSAKIVDDYYLQYEDFEDEFPDQKRAEKSFGSALDLTKKILPDLKETRWSNKTDFYTLFVCLSSQLRTQELPDGNIAKARTALNKFEAEIDTRLADERARVGRKAVDYVRNVEKGANGKLRRANRQIALGSILSPFFKARK